MKVARWLTIIALQALLVGLLLVSAGCGNQTAYETATPEDGMVERYEKGYRFDCNGWVYVHIEGDPYERGFQYGRLVAPELADAITRMEAITLDKTGKDWQLFVDAAERLYAYNCIEEFLQERGYRRRREQRGIRCHMAGGPRLERANGDDE